MRDRMVPAVVLGVIAVAVAIGVAGTLTRPVVPEFTPSRLAPEAVGATVVGPRTVTLDASDPGRWVYFDFSVGADPASPGPLDWDLAVNRFNLIVNGGEGFAGKGGALAFDDTTFEAVTSAPADGYTETVALRDSVNAALEDWYDYSFTSHLLTPRPAVYVVRTADGRYAKLEILSYYCPGILPGCVTFRYVYQGGSGRSLVGGTPGAAGLRRAPPPVRLAEDGTAERSPVRRPVGRANPSHEER